MFLCAIGEGGDERNFYFYFTTMSTDVSGIFMEVLDGDKKTQKFVGISKKI